MTTDNLPQTLETINNLINSKNYEDKILACKLIVLRGKECFEYLYNDKSSSWGSSLKRIGNWDWAYSEHKRIFISPNMEFAVAYHYGECYLIPTKNSVLSNSLFFNKNEIEYL